MILKLCLVLSLMGSGFSAFAADEDKTSDSKKEEVVKNASGKAEKTDKADKKNKSARGEKAKAAVGVKLDVNPTVVIKTSMGKIEVKLDSEKAPISVRNFMRYVDEKHYDGTIFHRVIAGFMIQGGGFKPDMTEKPTHEPIKNEASNGLSNVKGSIAMARTGVVDSATAQFYINVADNTRLDHRSPDPAGYGYAVFGQVTEGMDVVEKIRLVSTTSKGQYDDVPATPVIIESVRRK